MAISNLDGLIGSAKETVNLYKTASQTTVAAIPFSCFDAAGSPGAGSLNPGNTTNGIVPTDATTGCPPIAAFGGGATGYLANVTFGNTVASTLWLYDRLFSVGNITMGTTTATTTLTSQPSYSGRLPGGAFTGLEIWLETGGTALSNFAHTVSVTYTNQADADVSTGNQSTQNLISRRMFRFPLAAGDTQVKKIVSVTANGVASGAGVFNIHVMRPLWMGRVLNAGYGDTHGPHQTGMPILYADSSLFMIVQADSTASGLPYLSLTVVNG